MRANRQVGFIRTRSAKNIALPPEEPSEFSYFRLHGRNREQEEFSPYRPTDEPQPSSNIKKPPKPKAPTRATKMSPPKEPNKKEKIYESIREQIDSYESRGNHRQVELQENIGTIRNKIEELDEVIKDLRGQKGQAKTAVFKGNRQFKSNFDGDMSSSSSEQETEQEAVRSIPSPQIYRKFEAQNRPEEPLSSGPSQPRLSSVERHQQQKFITFNSRTRDQQIAIPAYSSSSQQEQEQSEQRESSEQYTEQSSSGVKQNNYFETVKDKQIVSERFRPENKETLRTTAVRDVHRNRGGVCFDVNVKDFLAPTAQEKPSPPRPKKRAKVDPRAQRLRLREAAKAYDRMARRAVFSPH